MIKQVITLGFVFALTTACGAVKNLDQVIQNGKRQVVPNNQQTDQANSEQETTSSTATIDQVLNDGELSSETMAQMSVLMENEESVADSEGNLSEESDGSEPTDDSAVDSERSGAKPPMPGPHRRPFGKPIRQQIKKKVHAFLKHRFIETDTNKDRVISAEEYQAFGEKKQAQFEALVNKIDSDQDGTISAEELAAARAAQGNGQDNELGDELGEQIEGIESTVPGLHPMPRDPKKPHHFRFIKIDTDQNKEISAEEIAAFIAMKSEKRAQRFVAIDADGDENLTPDEIKTFVKARAHAMFVKKFDQDGDGELSDTEKQAAKDQLQSKAKNFLQRFDTDGNGELDASEKEAAAAAWLEKLKQLKGQAIG